MPWGYLTSVTLPAVCVLAVFAARRAPRPLATIFFYLGFINELPIFAAYFLIGSAALAAGQGDLDTSVGWLALAISLPTLLGLAVLVARALRTGRVLTRALTEQWGPLPTRARTRVSVLRMLLWPNLRRRFDVQRTANVRYGDAHLHTLDLYRRRHAGAGNRPVFIHLHGGGFVGGRKNQESLPLIYQLARSGWWCVSANYRLSPAASRDDQVTDVREIIAWVRAHAHRYGADPNRIVLAGGSAGAHLAARAVLPEASPGLKAVVMLYGGYPDLAAIDVSPGTPPFLIMHGTHDTLMPVEVARQFVARLRTRSPSPVVYAELPGAGHTFDIFHSPRSKAIVEATQAFLDDVVRGAAPGSSRY
ncbi:alpha/beta hydrolase [Micromonospora polyrhachis]|uniref:Acetyl esterase/lipase n=1 Tax=Micromonospora polyrhachis TaxID=1282883 RepID=A0A7W7SV45_9ACTN|nr:alpha/beta hydrolase [Micromonospora polyrhachis]MBB4961537.1 acetyl esterase/lipase [Micromonospora polyrhachis]